MTSEPSSKTFPKIRGIHPKTFGHHLRHELSPALQQTYTLAKNYWTNHEIAEKQNLTPRTVATRLTTLRKKYNLDVPYGDQGKPWKLEDKKNPWLVVNFHLRPEDYNKHKREAKLQGLTVAAYTRKLLGYNY